MKKIPRQPKPVKSPMIRVDVDPAVDLLFSRAGVVGGGRFD